MIEFCSDGGPLAVMNQSVFSQTLVERAMGILQLDDATYESIEHDSNATTQAAAIVVVVGIASGIGAIRDSAANILLGPIGQVISWLIVSALIYFVGTKMIPSGSTEADLGQVLRLVGFAMVPQVANIFGFIPYLGALIAFVASIWGLVCLIKAIKHALEMSTGRAIATGIIASLIALIPLAILGIGLFAAS